MTDNFLNNKQSKLQRNAKYHFIRDCGFSAKESDRLKDWTHRHIIQYLYSRLEDIKTEYPKTAEEKEKNLIGIKLK